MKTDAHMSMPMEACSEMIREAPIYNVTNVAAWPNYYFGKIFMAWTTVNGTKVGTGCTAEFVKDKENDRSRKLVTAAHCVYNNAAKDGFPDKIKFLQACYYDRNGTRFKCLDGTPKQAKRVCVLKKGISPTGYYFVSFLVLHLFGHVCSFIVVAA